MDLDDTGRWPAYSTKYKIRVGVVMTIYAIYMIYAFVTFAMFMAKSKDKHSGLAIRNTQTLTLQFFACILLGTAGMISTAFQLWPAFLKLWFANIGFMVIYSSICTRAFQHIVISNLHNLTNKLASSKNMDMYRDQNSQGISSFIRQSSQHNRQRGGSQSSITSNTDFGGTDSNLESIEKKKLSAMVQQSGLGDEAYMGNGPERKLYKRLQKYAKLQPYVSNRALLFYNLGVLALASITSIVVNIVNPQFSLSPMSMECRMIWGFVPLMVICGSWVFFIMPVICVKCWKLKDAYGIRNDLLISMFMGIFCLILDVVWDNVVFSISKLWSGWFYCWLAAVVIHTVSITIPLIQAIRHTRSVTDRMHSASGFENSMAAAIVGAGGPDIGKRSDYNAILADPHEYRFFCDFAASCFCSELTAFIDEYQVLKNITVQALGSEGILYQSEESQLDNAYALRMANTGIHDNIGYLAMSNKAANYNARSLRLQTPPTVSMLETAKAVYPQYDLSDATPFPAASMDKLIAIFSVFINSNSYTAISLPPGIVLKLREKLAQNNLTITILDEIRDEVLSMLYFDVYTRYAKAR
ncbi:hypothetical protein LPJ75_002661 [Coemansia sp. RSA 2598]|nr:hypothetical protein LPJ75_002661 [Coemansia sp. RSA 2598]